MPEPMSACPIEHRMDTMRTYEHTVNALFDDPEISGDLLLIGLWLARATILQHPERGNGRWSFGAVGMTLFGDRPPGSPVPCAGVKVPRHLEFRVEDALRKDVPRYDPFDDNPDGWHCNAPMPRAPFCSRTPTSSGFETDPATGRRISLAVCGRKDHQEWYQRTRAENRAKLDAIGDRLPVPPANSGGRLERHIRLDWGKFYRRVNPDWKPPAEGAPSSRPMLTVIRNDDFEAAESSGRPALTLHEGGWR